MQKASEKRPPNQFHCGVFPSSFPLRGCPPYLSSGKRKIELSIRPHTNSLPSCPSLSLDASRSKCVFTDTYAYDVYILKHTHTQIYRCILTFYLCILRRTYKLVSCVRGADLDPPTDTRESEDLRTNPCTDDSLPTCIYTGYVYNQADTYNTRVHWHVPPSVFEEEEANASLDRGDVQRACGGRLLARTFACSAS